MNSDGHLLGVVAVALLGLAVLVGRVWLTAIREWRETRLRRRRAAQDAAADTAAIDAIAAHQRLVTAVLRVPADGPEPLRSPLHLTSERTRT